MNHPLPRHPDLMSVKDTALLVIDMQTRLLPVVTESEQVLQQALRLLAAAEILQIPVAATEQYPKGLGSSIPEIAEKIPKRSEKLSFSCGECAEIFSTWQTKGIRKILLCGIETHVCVQQTAYDLLFAGFDVFLAADAMSSRFETDHRQALRRMEQAGITLTSTEAALFEWCEHAGTEQFKAISKLVKDRSV